MTFFKLIIQSFRFYFKTNFIAALGVVVASSVIIGALIVGDSVKFSLNQAVHYRLGNIEYALTYGDKFFTTTLSDKLNEHQIVNAPCLYTTATMVTGGGKKRLNKVQVWGVNHYFNDATGYSGSFDSLQNNEIIIGRNLAEKLGLLEGDFVQVKLTKTSIMPANTPFVSEEGQVVTKRLNVVQIIDKEGGERLNLKSSQTSPYNAFVSLNWFGRIMKMPSKANMLFFPDNQTDEAKIREQIESGIGPEDIGLSIIDDTEGNNYIVQSKKVFFDDNISKQFKKELHESEGIITYFVNSFITAKSKTPYSFISSIDDKTLKDNEIIINAWLAEDLDISVGDNISINYFTIGLLRVLNEASESFVVKEIVPINNDFGNALYMPDIPGLSDAGNCRDWSTGVPVDLEAIRDKDEKYWKDFKGTPKAYINTKTAKKLWNSRFGSYTSFRIRKADYSNEALNAALQNIAKQTSSDLMLNNIRNKGVLAANGGVNFSELFMSLSFFVILAGLILTSLLFKFTVDKRKPEIGTLRAMGFSQNKISLLFLSEGILISGMGSLIGILFAVLYGKIVFLALNQIWYPIVRTGVLELSIQSNTIITGYFISVIISGLIAYLSLRKILKTGPSSLQKKHKVDASKLRRKANSVLLFILPIICVVLLSIQFIGNTAQQSSSFFISGVLLLIFFVLLANKLFQYNQNHTGEFGLAGLVHRNLADNKSLHVTLVLLLSLGTFIIFTTGANRKSIPEKTKDKTTGTGGYSYYIESTVPVLKDLNDKDIKRDFSIPELCEFTQIRVSDGDDAGCLNLNLVTNPKLFGVNTDLFENRFTFISRTDKLDEKNPWKSLNQVNGKVIPGIADQTVIQWGLGKKVGDTLAYQTENGHTFFIELIGGLESSIFQGNIVVSEDNFIRLFPSSSGSEILLLDIPEAVNKVELEETLNFQMREYGLTITDTRNRLAEFNSVENTYLSVFLVMGSFGLFIAIIGVAVVMARSIVQRKGETAVLLASGYSSNRLIKLLFFEYAIILSYGVVAGLLASIIAQLPAFIKQGEVSLSTLLISSIIIVINGLFWLGFIARVNMKNIRIIHALRND
ncbi:ABC transporter permease [Bacteroidales bacterium]|nr:ABC transporter permease [Bacteroidales bacterium]